MKENHKGHRERLRARFAKTGFEGFHDYEVLEFLLTYLFPRGDTKPLANRLIKRFGSFSKVLDANPEELSQVEGMGNTSALGLSAFRNALMFYFRAKKINSVVQLTKMTELIEFIRSQIGHKENEVLLAIYLNAKNEVLAANEISEGTVSNSAIYPRRLVEDCLNLKATSVILAHNHPGGIAEPSEQDITITNEIKEALRLVEATLQDHIIIENENYYSFNRNNLI
jgi:DNA repair protein RadC